MAADEWLERTRQALADYIPRRLETSDATAAAILLLVHHLHVHHHPRPVPLRDPAAHPLLRPPDPRLDQPVVHRVVRVDLPAEELRVELLQPLAVLAVDLEVH